LRKGNFLRVGNIFVNRNLNIGLFFKGDPFQQDSFDQTLCFVIDDFLSGLQNELSTAFQTVVVLLVIVNMTVFLDKG